MVMAGSEADDAAEVWQFIASRHWSPHAIRIHVVTHLRFLCRCNE